MCAVWSLDITFRHLLTQFSRPQGLTLALEAASRGHGRVWALIRAAAAQKACFWANLGSNKAYQPYNTQFCGIGWFKALALSPKPLEGRIFTLSFVNQQAANPARRRSLRTLFKMAITFDNADWPHSTNQWKWVDCFVVQLNSMEMTQLRQWFTVKAAEFSKPWHFLQGIT